LISGLQDDRRQIVAQENFHQIDGAGICFGQMGVVGKVKFLKRGDSAR